MYIYIDSRFSLVCFPGLSSVIDKASAGWGEETAHSVARRPQVIATGGAEGGNIHAYAHNVSISVFRSPSSPSISYSYSVSSSLRWICSWILPMVFHFFYCLLQPHCSLYCKVLTKLCYCAVLSVRSKAGVKNLIIHIFFIFFFKVCFKLTCLLKGNTASHT